MNALTLVVLLALVGCAHAPLDTVEIERKALDARNRVDALAESLGETKTPIMFFCAMVGESDAKCTALRHGYEMGRQAIVSAQRYIDAFAKTGQGLAVVDAGVTVIEAAVQEVQAETERLTEEVRNAVEGDPVASDQSRPADSGLGRTEAEAAEGEGASDPKTAGGHAQEVGAPAGSEVGQAQ